MPDHPPRKILVVDDDRLVLATLVHGLTQAGYEVHDADNGDDAILLARQHRPGLALLDIRMEGMSGFDVAAYLRDPLQIPFMFLSAFADEDTQRQVAALGALDYLVKPLDIARILPAVRRAFERAEGAAGVEPAAPIAATPMAVPSPQPAPPAAGGLPRLDPQAVAVGVLMHRFSIDRAAAWQRLSRQAQDEGRSTQQQAERLLDALEMLADRG